MRLTRVCVCACVCQVCSINVSLVASRWQTLTDDSRADTTVSHTEEVGVGGGRKKTVLTLLRLDLPQGWIQPLVDMMDYCNGHLNALFVMFKWQYILAGKGEGGGRNLTTRCRGGKWCVWGVNKKVSQVHSLLTCCRWRRPERLHRSTGCPLLLLIAFHYVHSSAAIKGHCYIWPPPSLGRGWPRARWWHFLIFSSCGQNNLVWIIDNMLTFSGNTTRMRHPWPEARRVNVTDKHAWVMVLDIYSNS